MNQQILSRIVDVTKSGLTLNTTAICADAHKISTVDKHIVNITLQIIIVLIAQPQPRTLGPTSNIQYDHNHFFDAKHQVTCYIDNSTFNIGVRRVNQIIPYIRLYLEFLLNYYTMNCLTLNCSKTKYTIIGDSKQIAETRSIRIKINQDVINCDGNITILGNLISSDN